MATSNQSARYYDWLCRRTSMKITAGGKFAIREPEHLKVENRRPLGQQQQLPQHPLVTLCTLILPQVIDRKLGDDNIRVLVDVLAEAHTDVSCASRGHCSVLNRQAPFKVSLPPRAKDVQPLLAVGDALSTGDAAAEDRNLRGFARGSVAQDAMEPCVGTFKATRACQ